VNILLRNRSEAAVHGTRASGRLEQHNDLLRNVLYRLALIIRCHQLPERSFFHHGRQVPLCARCLGITVGICAVPFYVRNLWVITFLVSVMVVDGGSQALGLRQSNNWLRLMSGIGFSLACGGLLERGIEWLRSM